MIRYQQEAAEIIVAALAGQSLTPQEVLQLLEKPQNAEHGDIAFPCFHLAKVLRQNPVQIAKTLAESLAEKQRDSSFAKIINIGPYLNFTVSGNSAYQFLREALERQSAFGKTHLGKGKSILIEYSSPNIAKEFHIGHFRNTMLGQALHNLYEATGHHVIAINHLGDWGSQFGKVMCAYIRWGKEEELQQAPIDYLTKLYVRFHTELEHNPKLEEEAHFLSKRLEDGDDKLKALWEQFVALSIDDLKKVYAKLGASFDHFIGESFYIDKIPALLKSLKEKNLLQESEGAQVVFVGDDMPPCLIVTGDGRTLYHTRDLAAAIYRQQKFRFDKCLYVVGSEQKLHFKQLFKVLELMGYLWAKRLEHVYYGLYRFQGTKFSTRQGKVVLMRDVLEEAKTRVLKIIEEKNPELENKTAIAEAVGLGALVFNDLATDRTKDIDFNWDEILDFEGDTGPYLQYTYARACSILRQAEKAGFFSATKAQETMPTSLEAPSAIQLMKAFGEMQSTIESAILHNKPSYVANYALHLAKNFNAFYRAVRVLDPAATRQEITDRLSLVKATCVVLKNSMDLVCIPTPDAM